MVAMGAKRRKLGNPLALAVMALLSERPMHPYQIAQTLRQRGKENSVKINFGSLYTVVQNLEKHGFVEVAEVQRQGNRPERTLYGLTSAGHEEMLEWMADLLAVPAREFPLFETGLSLMGVLPPDEVTSLLEDRLSALRVQAAGIRGVLEQLYGTLPRLFVIETEFQLHMIEAEETWVQGFLKEIGEGSLSGLDGWRTLHETGRPPPEWQELEHEQPLDTEGEGGRSRKP
ncbi:PadR family transcriptional regulator [Streptomyces scopuliridis RB72]|uniref:PadR family transcriptional regulator n=2 Tax=Streptomyces scopuliridis TaxID=452529 RepID=A0A2T7SPL1_9ACTN|nr:PadR family transcriptional regulator [Streptomyces scopuliridis RB72]